MKGEYITIIIFAIILAVSLLLIMLYREKIFKRKQESKKNSLLQGYGFYSDPITLPCTNNTGKCTDASTQKTIFKCIPHPATGKGCIDDKGHMTYNNRIVEKPCRQQCMGSLFTVQDGVEYNNVNINGSENQILQKLGCNRVANIRTGLDETDFFIGDFDIDTLKYKLKNCIPEHYQGYYVKSYTCNNYDTTGANNCRYTCGQDGSIKLNGLFDTKLSKNVLMYYPTEFDQEGVKRHVCYDINDVNQIEILNSVTEIPNDFYYPSICYKHVNEFNIENLIDLYPVGRENVASNNLNYNLIQQKYIYDNSLSNITKSLPKLISQDYDYYYDYENYIKLQLNNEIMLVKKININADVSFINNDNDNNTTISYINIKNNNIDDISEIIYGDNGNNKNVKYYNKPYQLNNIVNKVKVVENYIPININSMLGDLQGPVDVAIGLSTSTFSDNNNLLNIGDVIYYRGIDNGYNNGKLITITGSGTSIATVEGAITNTTQKIYWRKLEADIQNNTITFLLIDNFNSNITLDINTDNFLVTNNIFLKNGQEYDSNRELIATRNIDTLDYYINDSFFLFNREVPVPGVRSVNNGFFYPLFLKKFSYDSTIESKGTSIYITTDTININRSDKILLNDIQEKAFYILNNSGGENIYYYPLYLSNTKYTNKFNFPSFDNTTFYIPENDFNNGVTNKPEAYLDYLDFQQYASLAMVYKDGNDYKYPVFLTNFFQNVHQHTFVNYNDITFYMANTSNNHAVEEPPKKEYYLTDFQDLFEIGTVNVNINTYNLTNNTINFIPNNAQINQALVLPQFNHGSDITEDIKLYQNGNNIASINYDIKNGNKDIISVFRENDYLFNNISGNSIFSQKSKLYNKILESQNRKRVTDNSNYDTVINSEKKVIVDADFKLFQSPYIENPDGTTNNICYDKYNKPLASGTQVTLNSPDDSGGNSNKIIINVPCSDYNTDIGASCGVFGISIGSQSCQQERQSIGYIIKENTEALNLNNDYFNEYGYMQSGLDILDNKMVCLDKFKYPYNDKSNTKCFPTYFTRENEQGKVYAPGEEIYLTRYKRDYYLSTTDNNSEYPLNPLFWDRIFISTPDSEVSNYQTLLYENIDNNNYIFRTNQSGVTGIDPTKIAIQPVFRKNIVPYHNSNEYSVGASWWDGTNQLAKRLNVDSDIFNYNNIELTLSGNNLSTVSPGPSSIVKQVFNISYTDKTIKDLDLTVGDIFQTDFSFFNSIICSITGSYQSSFFDLLENIGILFKLPIDQNDDNNFYNLTASTINYTTINKNLKVGDYLVIVPAEVKGFRDILLDSTNFQSLFIDTNVNTFYNSCFEIILLEAIDINNKKITVRRNILNLKSANYFYTDEKEKGVVTYVAVPISDKLLDFNFPITNIDNDKITFDITFNVSYDYAKILNDTTIKLKRSLAFTPFITANYIKKSITTPNTRFDNINLYLSSLPQDAKTISALLDLRTETIGNQDFVYINEFRNDRYTSIDNYKTSFQTGDVINLEFANDKIVKLKILKTNIYYQDNNYDKRYDYYCTILSNAADIINNNNLKKNLSSYNIIDNEYYLAYYFNGTAGSFGDNWWPNITVLKTPRPGFESSMTITVYDGNNSQNVDITSLEEIGFFPLENNKFKNLVPVSNNNRYLTQSKILSEGNNIAYLKLSETIFTSSKGSITIENIKTIGKPEGIIYYPVSDVINDIANKKGSGAITSFTVKDVNVTPSIDEGDEFFSNNNYILRATNKTIAGYDYIDGNTNNFSATSYDDNKIYSQKEIVDYINPNQRIYYLNGTEESAVFNENTWQVKPDSIYNESSVINFANNESYLKDTVVRYEGRLWKANNNLFSGISVPSINDNNWQEITLTEIDLFSNQNNFFTFTNDTPSITNENLLDFNNLNINNYPLCVSDYTNQTNYCPQPTVKFTEKDPDYSNSFITVLPGASSLASIMGQAFLTHNGDDYLSLPAVPYNEEHYKTAQYLKDSGDIASAYNLSQYIYQVPILNNLEEGKPFCTNKWLDSGVSDITFANSIVFFMLPLDIDSQDYPSFGVSHNGTILTKNLYSIRNNPVFGMSMITFKDNNPVFVDIRTNDATYITNGYDSNLAAGESLKLTKIGGGSSVTLTVNKVGYYPIESSRVTNQGMNYKLGDIWYYTNPDNKITSHGYLQPETDGSISARNFYSYYTNYDEIFNSTNSNNLTIISKQGNGFTYDWVNNKSKEIIDYTISEPLNFIAGDYSADNNNILDIHIADNGHGEPLQANEYLIGTSNPVGQLTDGVSIYQIFDQDKFKCRMYGLFGTDYLSQINYRLDSNLINSSNQENPGLIFNNFSPDIFSNSALSVGVVSENINTPDYNPNLYNVFNLRSNDGTSSNISLLTNNFSTKAGNITTIPLPQAYDGNKALREFNIVNTTDLHNFFSAPYSETSNIYMGPVNKILPVLETEPTNDVIKFSAIRQSRGRKNIGTSFDCSFYFKPQGVITTYPGGGNYKLTQQNNIIYYDFSENGSGALTTTNGLNIKNNREYIFNITDSSMDDFILSFSQSSGNAFAGDILDKESTVINNGTLNIFYYINNSSIDYSDYNKDIFYKQKNIQRYIKLYYDTKLENMSPTSLTIYMGFNKIFNNDLVISNNQ